MALDTTHPNNYNYTSKHLEVSVLGINKLKSSTKLRHNIDLYNDNQLEKLVRTAAERLEIGTSVLRSTLQQLTHKPYQKELSIREQKEAETFLKSNNLLEKTNELIGKSGVIGEETNRLLMYLIFTSRLTANPLHCISLGSSGVGKTHLQSKVAELIPQEDKVEITVLSANAFYYFNRTELQHKLILIEDLDGSESVLYPLRELQSKKRITKTVVHKDTRGVTKTIHLTVEGPVSVAGCTTKESIYEDNSNRSFLLYIDESEAQDKKIMQYQRLLSAGKINQDEEFKAAELLRNVQRVLKPIKVINPYAEYLELPGSVFKPRRTNSHYLQFIEAITFYKQTQRESKVDTQTTAKAGQAGEEYIETTIEDIQEANELITEILLRKSDTLTGACRDYLERLKMYLKVNKQTTFTNAEIRRNLRVKETTLRRYNKQLLAEYYIRRIRNAKTKSYAYEIVNVDEYKVLKDQINNALQACVHRLDAASSPEVRHLKNGEVNNKKSS